MANDLIKSFSSMSMESSEVLGIIGILRESIKILTRNGRLMLSILLLTLLPYTFIALGIIYSLRGILLDLPIKVLYLAQTDPKSPEYIKLLVGIRRYLVLLTGVELLSLLAFLFVSISSMMATVYAAAVTYSGKYLSLKDLLTKIGKIWARAAITWFYVILMITGYTFLLMILMGITLLAKDLVALVAIGMLLIVMVVSLNLYLAIVWVLGFVVSVIEPSCYGIQALGKAEELSKGRKLQGFVLNLIVMLLANANLLGLMVTREQTYTIHLVILLFTLCIVCLVMMLMSVVYTVFYFECKKCQGEKVEIEGEMGSYSEVSTVLP